jgi:hypothetical protein
MKLRLEKHYYFSREFKGFGFLISANGPRVYKYEKNVLIELKLISFVFWIDFIYNTKK